MIPKLLGKLYVPLLAHLNFVYLTYTIVGPIVAFFFRKVHA